MSWSGVYEPTEISVGSVGTVTSVTGLRPIAPEVSLVYSSRTPALMWIGMLPTMLSKLMRR